MRKTKLIILPTKCLKTVGFLLLFLSCPVIGDWGRIRPESEMSQWSVQIEREGSCGLVRNPLGIENALTPLGSMECNAADATQNDTVSGRVAAHFPEKPVEGGPTRKALARERFAERRVGAARRERQERRAVSLDRRARRERETRIQRLSLDRRLESRRVADVESARRLSQREREEERRVTERDNVRRQRLNSERRARSVEERRLSRESPVRRAAERRASRSEERRSVREERMTRRMNRMNERTIERRLVERRSFDSEQESRRRDDREERRLSRERRSVEERRVRSSDDADARRTERRSATSNQREREEPEARSARRERQVRDVEISRRRGDSRREVSERRSPERESERREVSPDARRRTDSGLWRSQEVRLTARNKPEEERETAKMVRAYREKSAGMERYDRLTRFDLKEKQLDEYRRNAFDNIKDWMGHSWTVNYGDLTTTCLVGAAVYLLTVRQVKSV